MANFNSELNDSQTERLLLLIEECAEVQHMASKVLRHGYESFNPHDEKRETNYELLHKELGDLHFAISLLAVNEDIETELMLENAEDKAGRVGQYLHYNHKMPAKSAYGLEG